MHVESNKTKTFRPLLLCMINTPHGLSEYTNIWVHPIKTFLWQHILRIPFFYIRPKNRLHFYTPCQVLVINLDKTSSMAKFSWSFVRWAMLQTVNWVILPNGMMQNTLQLIMPQVCHITCSAILPALTLYKNGSFIVFTLVPPRVPQGVLLRPIYYFLQVRFRKQIMQYTGAARSSIVRVKAKAGVQGAEPLGGGQGAKPPEANAF